jgi:hypothetical protein
VGLHLSPSAVGWPLEPQDTRYSDRLISRRWAEAGGIGTPGIQRRVEQVREVRMALTTGPQVLARAARKSGRADYENNP